MIQKYQRLAQPRQMRVTGHPTRVSGWTLQNPGVTQEKRVSWKVCSMLLGCLDNDADASVDSQWLNQQQNYSRNTHK